MVKTDNIVEELTIYSKRLRYFWTGYNIFEEVTIFSKRLRYSERLKGLSNVAQKMHQIDAQDAQYRQILLQKMRRAPECCFASSSPANVCRPSKWQPPGRQQIPTSKVTLSIDAQAVIKHTVGRRQKSSFFFFIAFFLYLVFLNGFAVSTFWGR